MTYRPGVTLTAAQCVRKPTSKWIASYATREAAEAKRDRTPGTYVMSDRGRSAAYPFHVIKSSVLS